MGKNTCLAEVKRVQIAAVHRDKSSYNQILKQLGVSKSSLQKAIEKFNRGEIFGHQKKSVGPCQATLRDERHKTHRSAIMYQLTQKDWSSRKKIGAQQLSRIFSEQLSTNILHVLTSFVITFHGVLILGSCLADLLLFFPSP